MPLSKYFRGAGAKVMDSMIQTYGEKKGKNVFYATANKVDMKTQLNLMKKTGKLKSKAMPKGKK